MTKAAKKNATKAATNGKRTGADDAKAAAAALLMLPQKYEAKYPLAKLKEFPGNPKEHDIGAISESMRVSGFAGAVLVQRSTGRIIAGHGTTETVRQRGGRTVPVILIDCDDRTARRLLLAFNRLPQLGGFRDDMLARMLASVVTEGGDAAALLGTGYDQDDVERLAKLLRAPDAFPKVGDDLPTEHQCPKCGYEWSGKPKPAE